MTNYIVRRTSNANKKRPESIFVRIGNLVTYQKSGSEHSGVLSTEPFFIHILVLKSKQQTIKIRLEIITQLNKFRSILKDIYLSAESLVEEDDLHGSLLHRFEPTFAFFFA